MIRNLILAAAVFASLHAAGQSPSFQDRARQYVQQYRELAKEEQRRSGVPAAITLGQGILETDAGRSELATLANNHFGIKCKKSWTGETFAHDDDAPQECFRKYGSAIESYRDHSDYLKTSKRYESCFAQSPTDYASWARELRKCGYATNPKYAQILIKIIEDYQLQDYTYAAMDPTSKSALIASASSPVAAAMMSEQARPAEVIPEHDTPARNEDKPEYGKVITKDGARGFYARKGDVLLEYAIRHKIRYAKLLEINGLPDAPLAADMFISLDKGSRITRIIARDPSEPAPPVTYVAPAKKEAIRREEPVLAAALDEAAAPATSSGIPKERNAVPPTRAVQREETRSEPVAAPPQQPAPAELPAQKSAPLSHKQQNAAVSEWVATRPTAPVEKAVNIADELAVEEQPAHEEPATEEEDDNAREAAAEAKRAAASRRAAEEPQDEFSRLKARLDRVVYAPKTRKPAAPAPTATAPVTTPATQPAVVKPAPTLPTPASATAAGGKSFHVVKSGETAFGIARQYGISMKELMALNDLNFEAIKVGQKLRVK